MRLPVVVVGFGMVSVCPAVVCVTMKALETSTVVAALPMEPPVAWLLMLTVP